MVKHYIVNCARCGKALELNLKVPDNVDIVAENPDKTFFNIVCPVCNLRHSYKLSEFSVRTDAGGKG